MGVYGEWDAEAKEIRDLLRANIVPDMISLGFLLAKHPKLLKGLDAIEKDLGEEGANAWLVRVMTDTGLYTEVTPGEVCLTDDSPIRKENTQMSEQKKQGFIAKTVTNALSIANKGVGDRPHKKVGTAVIAGSAAYGYLVDPVGGILGAIAGLGIRYPEKALAAANYADSVVDALLGRKPPVETDESPDTAFLSDEVKSELGDLIAAANDRKAKGMLAKGDEALLSYASKVGL